MGKWWWSLAAAAAIAVVAASACSTHDAGKPCNDNPWQCSSGQTCWPVQCTCSGSGSCDPTNCTPRFDCTASVAGRAAGQSCENKIGKATCGDDQACIGFADGGTPTCSAFCDSSHPCPSDQACVPLTLGNSSLVENVCVTVGSDGGYLPPPIEDAGGGSFPDAGGDVANTHTA